MERKKATKQALTVLKQLKQEQKSDVKFSENEKNLLNLVARTIVEIIMQRSYEDKC